MSDGQSYGLRTTLTLLILIFVIAAAGWLVTRSVRSHLANNLSNEALQTRFISYATTISTLRRLEIAQLKQVEVFERKSEASVLWDYLQLPPVVVRATVPVQYQYYVDLNDPWQFDRKDDNLAVLAPQLKVSTPAADISALNFEVRQGSFFRNEREVAVGLQKEMTPLLEQRGLYNLHLVRETARQELAKIIQDWISPDKALNIKIIFVDEDPSFQSKDKVH
jgi:hypothetical protein